MKRAAWILLWVAIAAPAIYQLALLTTCISHRIAYPYDLEWMEGGLLDHAQRIADGSGIYVTPSVDFIPYLYTPLYPGLLAALSGLVGIGYTVGRIISVLSLLGIAGVAFASITGPAIRIARADATNRLLRGIAIVGALSAIAVFAAGYPYVEGWYDLVRADTMAILMVTLGVHLCARWARMDSGVRGHARIAVAAALLATAFFAKQTAILYVAWSGVIVFALAWRRAFTFGIVAGVIGLGGAALLNRASGGWFWIYVFKIHQTHDFNMDRFWLSFGNILWHWPALSIVIAMTIVVVATTAIRRRKLPEAARPFVLWTLTYAVSTIVGALGWGTEFAHFNAYMPALLHGGLAVGAALPALYACVPRDDLRAPVASLAGIAIAITLFHARWQPKHFEPTAADIAAGNKLIARIAAIPGEVWVPYHPWYSHLAGKHDYVHRMGIRDVTARKPRPILGLSEAISSHKFAAIVFDDRPPLDDVPGLAATYRPELNLPADEKPHVYTGANVHPDVIWVPSTPAPPPPGGRILFNFESGTWTGWKIEGAAWGRAPVDRPRNGQGQVRHYDGRFFATSMWDNDAATGTATSPDFVVDNAHLAMRLGGGTDKTKLRVELRVDAPASDGSPGYRIARTASVPEPAGELMRDIVWDVSDLRGQTARLVMIDDATGGWGHLDVDEVVLQP